MKLEHIAPYLPYKLNVRMPKHQFKYGEQITLPLNGISISSEGKMIMEFLKPDDGLLFSNECERKCLPILRPLSDLTKSITHNGETFVPIEKLKDYYNSLPDSFVEKLLWVAWDGQFTVFGLEEDPLEVAMPYSMYQKVFEWHFDVFGLIDSGEAIDINTLKS